jgi:hypothetical protein
LEGVTEDGLEEQGSEEVRGVETTHYAGEIDMGAVFEQAREQFEDIDEDALGEFGTVVDSEAAIEEFEDQFGEEPVPVEVWIDDDGLTRRMQMSFEIEGETVTQTIEMFDFGEPVDIEVPDEADSVDMFELLGELGGN